MEKLYKILSENESTLGSVESIMTGLFSTEFTNVQGASKFSKVLL